MRRKIKLSQAAKFTLFSIGFILFVLLIVYGTIILDMIADETNPAETLADVVRAWHGLLFIVAGILSYTISSVIIDNLFNPLRQISAKMTEVSNMNFDNPLVVDASDDELRDVAYAFNTMTAKLNKYINMQKRFVQDASHELASPITVINGHTDLALRRGGENPQLVHESLTTIKSEIARMSELVDGLLMLAKSDSGSYNYNYDKVDIAKLLHKTTDEARLINPDFVFEVSIKSTQIYARCDFYAIQRVIRILISNAIKYGEHKKIIITAEKNHGLITVSIKNFGIGINNEDLERIFERFYRIDTSRTKKTGSSGLGLAIAREIITAHGGEIFAESQTDEWTKVSFRISSSNLHQVHMINS